MRNRNFVILFLFSDPDEETSVQISDPYLMRENLSRESVDSGLVKIAIHYSHPLVTVALCNRADHYIFAL